MTSLAHLRKDFPVFQQPVHGYPLVYLDSAATAQKPQSVIDAVSRYYEHDNANIHRGIHTLSERATEQYEAVRAHTARFINAAGPDEIIFTRNATEGINLIAATWGDAHVQSGDTILLTELEHHANIVPWQQLARRKKAHLAYIPIDPTTGLLDLSDLDALLARQTKVLALTHASNVLGTIPPVADIVARAHARGVTTVVDGAQAAPHVAVDVQTLGCDFYVLTGHKLYGPTGVGVVWGRREILADLEPYQTGGAMIERVERDSATWQEPPQRFEAGTPDIAGVIGFGAALSYVEQVGVEAIRLHEQSLIAEVLAGAKTVPGMVVYGPQDAEQRGSVAAFTVAGIHPHDLATLLDEHGVAIRSGHHCAQILHRVLGQVATARVSVGLYTNAGDIAAFYDALRAIRHTFQR
ncbi:MAG: SufS family cysteine desulfurase [Candidatus Kerfeldbacteria bacterium]|nr:SufS family cysteine desulfurase [Candidatus Kerfeldbacteria bacterium]